MSVTSGEIPCMYGEQNLRHFCCKLTVESIVLGYFLSLSSLSQSATFLHNNSQLSLLWILSLASAQFSTTVIHRQFASSRQSFLTTALTNLLLVRYGRYVTTIETCNRVDFLTCYVHCIINAVEFSCEFQSSSALT